MCAQAKTAPFYRAPSLKDQSNRLLCLVLTEDTMDSIEGAITVTFTPEECEKKVAHGDNLSMHYTGTIDQTSPVGEKGKQFDSSVGR
jgi:FKBP-type peptidyl-prolyl cis-trans isomerase